jgi:hypothetical protein
VVVQDIGCNPDPVGGQSHPTGGDFDGTAPIRRARPRPRDVVFTPEYAATSRHRRDLGPARSCCGGIGSGSGPTTATTSAAAARLAPTNPAVADSSAVRAAPVRPAAQASARTPPTAGGACTGNGGPCSGSCNWGDACPGCCSGYCGQYGSCDTAGCTGLGCACASGTFQPCDAGLVCCSSYPGMPGAQGSCQYGC